MIQEISQWKQKAAKLEAKGQKSEIERENLNKNCNLLKRQMEQIIQEKATLEVGLHHLESEPDCCLLE